MSVYLVAGLLVVIVVCDFFVQVYVALEKALDSKDRSHSVSSSAFYDAYAINQHERTLKKKQRRFGGEYYFCFSISKV